MCPSVFCQTSSVKRVLLNAPVDASAMTSASASTSAFTTDFCFCICLGFSRCFRLNNCFCVLSLTFRQPRSDARSFHRPVIRSDFQDYYTFCALSNPHSLVLRTNPTLNLSHAPSVLSTKLTLPELLDSSPNFQALAFKPKRSTSTTQPQALKPKRSNCIAQVQLLKLACLSSNVKAHTLKLKC